MKPHPIEKCTLDCFDFKKAIRIPAKKRVVHKSIWPTIYRVECGDDGAKRTGYWDFVTCEKCLAKRKRK